MYVATNGFTTRKGHSEDVAELFRHQGGVREQPGFSGFELWQVASDGETDEFLVVTHWESEGAHTAWTQSEAFRQAHAGPFPDYILAPVGSRGFHVQLSYSAEAG